MGGLQPLTHFEIADFAERTLQLPRDMIPFFSWAMETTDDEVMAVYADKRKEATPESSSAKRKHKR